MIKLKKILDVSKPHYFAVSGGVDSIAACHFLMSKAKRLDITILYFNHALSDLNNKMEESVIRFAEEKNNGKVLIVKRTGEFESGKSLEMACHDKRFEAFGGLDKPVILAHHLNDCVESYLMNCFKGKNCVPVPIKTKINDKVSLLRPFMLTLKSDFVEYANKFDLNKYVVEDITNYDPTICKRNWIRNKLIPAMMEEYDTYPLNGVVRKKMLAAYKELLSST